MMPKNVLGIVYSNSFDASLDALTARRTMGSVPFGGRYRLIDFPLSNLVNCGVTKVGVIANSNFLSLMDHVGSGRPWDLSRKVDGLTMLPPFTPAAADSNNRIDSLNRIMEFISDAKQEYVLLMDSNFVCNMDCSKLFDFHSKKNADITIAYCNGDVPTLPNQAVLDVNEDAKVTNIGIDVKTSSDVNYSANIILIRKALLERLINDAISLNYKDFETDLIQGNVGKLNIYGYEAKGYSAVIESLQSYYNVNMELLNPENCDDLFNRERPVYTKVRDDMPAIYGVCSDTSDSLIADGCIIKGTVENCVLARGVYIAEGAVVKNSIIMQDCYISANAKINCAILDIYIGEKLFISPVISRDFK